MAANPNPTRIRTPRPTDPDYGGRQDYQGNHDVFEMPEEHKPAAHRLPALPIRKVALAIMLLGVIVLLVLASISIIQQSGSLH